MTIELGFVLAVLCGAIALFVSEALPVDLVALCIVALLILSGIVSPAEGFAGFSNPATVTVAAMFVLSAGVYRTGILNAVGVQLTRLGRRSLWLTLIVIMVGIGTISAFINNTAAVAIFMPLVIAAAQGSGRSPSKLLMPLSFAGMFGGVCTLIGTSTNILVNEIAVEHGIPAFGMFEFSRLGLVFFGVGLVYMLLVGVRLIPDRRAEGGLTESFQMSEYLADIILLGDSASVGKKLAEAPLVHDVEVRVIEIRRGELTIIAPPPDTVLQENDVLRIRGDVAKIEAVQRRKGVRLKAKARWEDEDLQSDQAVLVEAVVAPDSELEGRSLADVNFAQRFSATALALRTRRGLVHERLGRTPLRAGDVLLCEVKRDALPSLRLERAFVVVSEVQAPRFRLRRAIGALAILAAVVGAPTLGLLSITASAAAGAVLMVLTKCLTLEEAYRAISARVIVLLAGVLALGLAVERTGGAKLIATLMVDLVGDYGPVALVAVFYLMTSLLTELMSNNATAALIAPIAIAASSSMGIDPRPTLMAVMFAASASFMTPVGYQTNTMIFGAGRYRFSDFVRVGAPLNLIFWILSMWLIPLFWPFTAK